MAHQQLLQSLPERGSVRTNYDYYHDDDDGIDDDDDDDDEGGGCGDDNTSLLGTGIGALSKYLKLKGRFSGTRWKVTLFLPHLLALFGTDVH